MKGVKEGIGDTHLSDTYVVFEPNQVKSAEKNRGTFSPTNPDITMNLTRSDKATPIALIEDLKREAARRDPRNRQPSTAEVAKDIETRAPVVVP